MEKIYDVITVGAGASGIICSIRAAERGKSVLLLEKGDRPGRKILASGNGRCNLMNCGTLKYYGDEAFAGKVFRKCSEQKLADYFRHLGLMTCTDSENRVYPFSNQSATVMNILKAAMEVNGVQFMNNSPVTAAVYDGKQFNVHISTGKQFQSRKLVISCGGEAQPKLGGTRDGYQILESMGHSIAVTAPALVPLKTDRRSISGLSGIRAGCHVGIYSKDQLMHSEEGEILFTDYGVSGICIMQCARFVHENQAWLEIDFLHRIRFGEEELFKEIKRHREMYRNLSPVILMDGILAEKISYAVLKQAGIPMKGEKAGDLNDDNLRRIIYTASHYRINITGTRGFDYAQVTSGGAECSEFDPSTMSSRNIPGLYATGEVLNVDGDCGGYNLMFAFASGLIAGEQI